MLCAVMSEAGGPSASPCWHPRRACLHADRHAHARLLQPAGDGAGQGGQGAAGAQEGAQAAGVTVRPQRPRLMLRMGGGRLQVEDGCLCTHALTFTVGVWALDAYPPGCAVAPPAATAA